MNSLFESLLKALKAYLTGHPAIWTHTHAKSIGEIEQSNPWREDVWRHKNSGFYIVYWQNLKHIPCSSGPTPRYVWHLRRDNHDWCLTFHYDTCPMK